MSEDLISRKALIDAIEQRYNKKKGTVPDNWQRDLFKWKN